MNKRKLIIVLILFIAIMFIAGFSYAFYYFNDSLLSNSATSSCFKLQFNDQNDISLIDTVPLSEEAAKELTPYKFTITNTCNTSSYYDVNLEMLEGTTIESSEIRYSLDNVDSRLLSERSSVSDYVNQNVLSSRNLISGILNQGESKTYELRLWVNEDSLYQNSAEKDFISKVVVIGKYNSYYRTISFDAGEMIGEIPEVDSYDRTNLSYSIHNGVVTMTAKANDAYAGFPIYAYFEKNKVYHFSMDSDGEYDLERSNAGDTVQAYWADAVLGDRLYNYMFDKTYTFKSDIDGLAKLRLDVNQNGATHTFSNFSVKEVIDDRYVGKGQTYGELPTPAKREGYIFDGWYTAPEGGEYVTSKTKFTLDNNQVLYAHWKKASKITIDLGGEAYNSSGYPMVLYRPVGDYVTLPIVTHDVESFKKWEVQGNGNILKGQTTPKTYSSPIITSEHNDDYRYFNFKNNLYYNVDSWDSVSYDYYTPVIGHTYEISLFMRVNDMTNCTITIRHSAYNNDYNSVGRAFEPVRYRSNWTKHVLTRTFNSETIETTAGDTHNLQPLLQLYSSNLGNIDYSYDIDVRNIVIKDLTTGEYVDTDASRSEYILEVGEGDIEVTATWYGSM
ncbi:MAG: hypothetical protein E7159_04260 [Firmicutes bacterium]|nr:hypothetical protein [Bacillota bacterium]